MKTTINFPQNTSVYFSQLAIGDVFALDSSDEFIGIKIDETKCKDEHNCVVLTNKKADGYARPGNHSYVLGTSRVRLVEHATYNVK